MEIMYCSTEDYNATALKEIGRYNNIRTITGTLGLHSFIPKTNGEIEVKQYSECISSEKVKLY